MIWSERNTSQI